MHLLFQLGEGFQHGETRTCVSPNRSLDAAWEKSYHDWLSLDWLLVVASCLVFLSLHLIAEMLINRLTGTHTLHYSRNVHPTPKYVWFEETVREIMWVWHQREMHPKILELLFWWIYKNCKGSVWGIFGDDVLFSHGYYCITLGYTIKMNILCTTYRRSFISKEWMSPSSFCCELRRFGKI